MSLHPLLIRLAHELLRKAERSQGERVVSLKLDAEVLPELHQANDPDALAHLALLLDQLEQTGWVELRLNKGRAFQTLADRQPTLVLHDALALTIWSSFTPTLPRWSRQLVESLCVPGVLQVPNSPTLLDYLLRNPLPWFKDLSPAHQGYRSICANYRPAISKATARYWMPVKNCCACWVLRKDSSWNRLSSC
ncbi:MAG: hypothetical protein JWL63_1801 [Rhodocyclales bacterium]|nr:hypothetical protein [Rhodocyclales bacterium]